MAGFNDFMDKAGAFASMAAEKAKDLASVAAAKTKQVSRIAKLNMDISGEKDTIRKAYTELGRLYYEAHGAAPDGAFAQSCQEIDAAKEKIAAMEAEIAQLKQEIGEDDTAQDADFEAVVDQTEDAAGVDVEITVEEEPEAPQEPQAPFSNDPCVNDPCINDPNVNDPGEN